MPRKECNGAEIKNHIDEILDEIEDTSSLSKGKGLLTEDKYDEIMSHVEGIKSLNNKMKCILDNVPHSEVEPEGIVEEMHGD